MCRDVGLLRCVGGCGVEGGNDGGLSLFSVLLPPGLISKQQGGETTSVSACSALRCPHCAVVRHAKRPTLSRELPR